MAVQDSLFVFLWPHGMKSVACNFAVRWVEEEKSENLVKSYEDNLDNVLFTKGGVSTVHRNCLVPFCLPI